MVKQILSNQKIARRKASLGDRLKDLASDTAVRIKYSLDAVIEPLFAGTVTAYGLDHLAQYIIDLNQKGEPLALAVEGGALLAGASVTALEFKTHFLFNALRKRWSQIGDKFRQAKKASYFSWARTPLFAILATYLATASYYDTIGMINRVKHPPKIAREARPSEQPSQPGYATIPPEYRRGNGIPMPVRAQIFWATNTEKGRTELTAQINEFESKYKAIARRYYDKHLAGDARIAFPDIVGLLMQESSMNPYAVSNMGAAGLGQQMPFTALKYAKDCGNGRVYITKNVREGLRTGNKEFFRMYSKELKNKMRRIPKNQLAQFHAPLDPVANICMTTLHLRFLENKYPQDSKELLILKYNTRDSWVEFAKEIMGTGHIEDLSHFFRDQESKEYPFKVGARAHIYEHFPESGGKVRDPSFYLRQQAQVPGQITHHRRGVLG